MKKPVIGISGSVIIDGSGNFAGYRRSYVNEDYVQSVIRNGGIPFIIPFSEDEDVINEQMNFIDGLILSGGHDVSPRYYKEDPHQKLGGIYPERDEFDFMLLKKAEERNIPVLGICRGFQLINVYFGGTLYQDLGERDGFTLKHNQVKTPDMPSHMVKIDKESKLHALTGKDEIMVNSFHHQIIKEVGNSLNIAAIASDGVIESVEHKDKNIFGVQWHPEMLHRKVKEMNLIFRNIIELASK